MYREFNYKNDQVSLTIKKYYEPTAIKSLFFPFLFFYQEGGGGICKYNSSDLQSFFLCDHMRFMNSDLFTKKVNNLSR